MTSSCVWYLKSFFSHHSLSWCICSIGDINKFFHKNSVSLKEFFKTFMYEFVLWPPHIHVTMCIQTNMDTHVCTKKETTETENKIHQRDFSKWLRVFYYLLIYCLIEMFLIKIGLQTSLIPFLPLVPLRYPCTSSCTPYSLVLSLFFFYYTCYVCVCLCVLVCVPLCVYFCVYACIHLDQEVFEFSFVFSQDIFFS